jgi:hypothetical protein
MCAVKKSYGHEQDSRVDRNMRLGLTVKRLAKLVKSNAYPVIQNPSPFSSKMQKLRRSLVNIGSSYSYIDHRHAIHGQ